MVLRGPARGYAAGFSRLVPASSPGQGVPMAKLPLGSVTMDELGRLATLESLGITEEPWDSVVEPPDEETTILLRYLTGKLARAQPTTLNEATLWSRALYPLLELAETGRVRAWAEV